MHVEEIIDGESLSAWLKGLPQETDEQREDARRCAVSIAHRAAMRVLPSFWLWGWNDEGGELTQDSLVGLRCALISSVATVSLTDEIETAARHAGQNANLIYKSVGTSGAASLQATIAGLASAIGKKFVDAADAAPTACYMNFGLGRAVEIQSDAFAYLGGAEILLDPLWRSEIPKGLHILDMWRQVREKQVEQRSDWQFWIDWYEKTLAGQPQDRVLHTKIALIDPKDWDKGADHVNGLIQRIIEEHNRRTVQTVKAAVVRNRPILELQLAALDELLVQEIERVRSTNSLEPEVRDGLLSALKRMQEAAREVSKLLPATDSLTDADAAKMASWAKVIKNECLHWNAEAKKFVTGRPADERVAMAGRIVLASAVAGPLTLMGLAPLAAVAGGAIILNDKFRDLPKIINKLRSGTSPD